MWVGEVKTWEIILKDLGYGDEVEQIRMILGSGNNLEYELRRYLGLTGVELNKEVS